MKLTADVDVPTELIQAARAGRLVLFIGAGASKNDPSGLPMFAGLAQQIATSFGEEFDDPEHPDRFLGGLEERHPLMKEQVKAITGSSASRPNLTHRAIARLAAAGRLPVVSTNYDEHVEHAALEEGLNLGDRYTAPALPLGRSFSGVVYLHGAASRPAEELVVTDKDFGRAYLTDGWARRFVQELFLNWTVLFVGYSHNDVVMTYLARGLPPTTERYVLTDEPNLSLWRTLQIKPVEYPAANDHASLAESLFAWAKLTNMGQLDHYARVKEIVQSAPPQVPEDEDYLVDVLRTPTGARAFASVARGRAWLEWAETQDIFRMLFAPGRCDEEAAYILASWFADAYVAHVEHSTLALRTVARLGSVVSGDLMWRLVGAQQRLHESSPEHARQWAAVLVAGVRTQPDSDAWFNPFSHPLSGADLLPVLRRAFVPRLTLSEERPWFPYSQEDAEPGVTADVVWAVSGDEAKYVWEKTAPGLEHFAFDVVQILEQALLDSYQLLAAFDPTRTRDRWSAQRLAIEPHDQDRYNDDETVVIDALRDAAMILTGTDQMLITRWMSSKHPLFRRLALHLLIEVEVPADEKIALALDHDVVFDYGLLHEVFRLLQVAAPQLGIAARGRLLDVIVRGPGRDNDLGERLRKRAVFDRLEWLSRYAETWPELDFALSDIRAADTFGVRDHPDLSRFMSDITWGDRLPISVDELRDMVADAGASAAVRHLINLDYSDHDDDATTWENTCRLIREASAADLDLSLKLLPAFELTPVKKSHELVAAAVHGWAERDLTDAELSSLMNRLQPLAARPEHARSLSELLRAATMQPHSSDALAALDILAERVWDTNAAFYSPAAWDSALMEGLNSWPGLIAQYWLNRVSLRWHAEGDLWDGLSDSEKSALRRLLEEGKPTVRATSGILTGKLHFLFAADSEFAVAELFPLFDLDVSPLAADAWFSFLHSARLPPDLLEAGFWDIMLRAAPVVRGFEDRGVARQYWHAVASVAVHSTAHVVDRPALIATLARSPQQEWLIRFLRSLATATDDAQKDAVWSTWLATAMTERLNSPPGVVSSKERSAWSDLALSLATVEALEAANAAPAPLSKHTRLAGLPASLTSAGADVVVDYVTKRVRITPSLDYHLQYELNSLVTAVQPHVDPQLLRDLTESAIQQGFHDALRWLD